MKTKYLLFVLPLVALCACNKNGLETQENDVVSISAAYGENNDTKTVLTESGTSPYTYARTWSGTESLSVWYLNTRPYTKYTFDYGSETTGVANFTTESFKTGGFETDDEFFVAYGNNNVIARAGTSDQYYAVVSVPAVQTYNSSDIRLGLSDNFIPMLGYIKVGDGDYPKNNIKLSTCVAIIKLVLTNGTGSAQTINNITLTTSNEVGKSKRLGIAGQMYCEGTLGGKKPVTPMFYDPGVSRSTSEPLYAGSAKNTIKLNCGNISIAKDETKVFSFVVCGKIKYNTLTWKAWSDSESTVQVGSTITSPNCPALNYGKIYTKTAIL